MKIYPFKGIPFDFQLYDPQKQTLLVVAEIFPVNIPEYTLTKKELSKMSSFYREQDKEAYAYRHHLLNTWLSGFSNIQSENLEFVFSKEGKPALKNSGFHFNISRSGKFLAFGFGPSQLGVDIECLRDASPFMPVANRHYHPEEKKLTDHNTQDFFTIWTRKEAIVKATGSGLTEDLDTINSLEEYYMHKQERFLISSYVQQEQFAVSIARSEKLFSEIQLLYYGAKEYDR